VVRFCDIRGGLIQSFGEFLDEWFLVALVAKPFAPLRVDTVGAVAFTHLLVADLFLVHVVGVNAD